MKVALLPAPNQHACATAQGYAAVQRRCTYSKLKRAMDLTVAAVALVLALIPMAFIALAVWLTSGRPVLFKQRRGGLHGQAFTLLKFRTMRVHDDRQAPRQASKKDPRVTKVGQLLRRLSLDELPQLVHVLSGDMSLVGPRPHALEHDRCFREHVAGYDLRANAKPGITGLAQVSGFRGETQTLAQMQQRVELDLLYIESWSLWSDVKILLRTALVCWFDKRAY